MTAPVEPGWTLLGGVLGATVLGCVLVWRRGKGWLGFLLMLLACAAAGGVAGKLRTEMRAAPVLLSETRAVSIEGVIAEIDAGARNRRLRLEVFAIEGLSPRETPAYVRFSIRDEPVLSPGRTVRCRAILSPPPRPVVPGDYAFHRDAWFQKLGAVGFSVGACEPLARSPPSGWAAEIARYIGALRRAISEHVYASAGPGGGGMAAAIIAGDRSFIDVDDAEALRVSGLSHLISISGVHMVLAGGAFFIAIRLVWPLFEPLALRFPVQRVAAGGAMIACTLYFLISGGEVATQRAYIMALIGFGAKLMDRPAISLRSLAVAMVIVVALQPESVVTPGFQMSFAASAALVALFEIWPRLEGPGERGIFSRLRGWALATIATSLAASAATLPFAVHHFERAAVYSVLANIIASPIISLWTTPAAVAAALASIVGLEEPFFRLMGQSLDVVIWIAHTASDASPETDLPRLGPAAVFLSAAAIAIFVILRGGGRLVAIAPLSLALALWVTGPRTIGYVAVDGAVYVRSEGAWLLVDLWRGDRGLRPLAVRDGAADSPCNELEAEASCSFFVEAGEIRVLAPVPLERSSGDRTDVERTCPEGGRLSFVPRTGAAPLNFDPCALAARGGAVIELVGDGRRLRVSAPESERPWSGDDGGP